MADLAFLRWAIRDGLWSFYVIAVACFGVGMFMVVDRIIQHRRRPALNNSLKACINGSLREVNHQIWLLKNVLWWYLLPPSIGIICVSVNSAWQAIARSGAQAGPAVALAGGFLVFCGLLYWGIYRLNQTAVRKSLDPRRKDLEALLGSIE